MRRVAVIAVVLACAAVVAVVGTGAKNDSGGYKVRAIFDSAFSVIPGEDVKIAGVKVGKIDSLDITPEQKAAVVLRIDKPGFGDFRKDATCSIRPQSLIGEKFVECAPTQQRAPGTQVPPPLKRIDRGAGKGQYLLPVSQTSRTVDLDLLNNILRLPYRQRFSIILNEFGTGLAGRGDDLNMAIRNADPALRETDKVLKILGDQNRVLENLAVQGDRVLAPLAQRRNQVADFVVKANTTAQATAAERGNLERNLQRFPRFLSELRPTLVALGGLSDQMTPVLSDLKSQAPNINRLIRQLGPFSEAGRASFPSLGDAADVGRRALIKARPVTSDLRGLAQAARPVASDLSAILTSLRATGGIERLMDYLFLQVAAINGFDSAGHYLRAGLLVNLCSTYVITPSLGCSSNFPKSQGANARAASVRSASYGDPRRSPFLRREDAALRGRALPTDQSTSALDAAARAAHRRSKSPSSRLALPDQLLPGAGAPKPSRPAASTGPSAATPSAAGTSTSPPVAPSSQSQTSLLDYLLGGGA